MVGIDEGLVWIPYEVRLPSCEGMDYSKKFLVINIPIPLHGVESLGKESDRMELAFLIPLLKDSADSISRGITIDHELVFESGLS